MTSYPSVYNITPSIFMTSFPIHMLSPYCFHDNTTTIPGISPTIFDITATVCVSSHRWHTHLYRCIALSKTSQQVCKSSHLAHVSHHTQSKSHHIHSLWHQWSCFMTPQTLYSWHQISSVWHHIHSLGHHTTLCMTSSPLHLTSRPLYLCHHTHPIEDITATIWMVSHPVYLWNHIPCIYDIISSKYDITTLCVDDTTLGICVTSFALQMTSHTLYHTKPQYLLCHIHFRHDITPPVSDIAPTVSLSSQPLHWYHTHFWMTSHPPSVWHPMPYIEHHIQSLCHHSTVLMTSQPLNMKPHPVCRATYTLYMRHHSHSLCPHTQSIDNITPTLCMTSHSPYVWHRLPYTRHHILTLWPQTTVSMSSHPLYLTWCPLCVDVPSHPLYWWYHTNCISEITSAKIHEIISSVYDMTATGSVS